MDHTTRNLAGTPHCNVLLCGCGMLHVTLGPVTMRVEPRAAATLRDVLDEALARLVEVERGEAARRGPEREVSEPEVRAAPRLRLASSRGDELSS
jgi:hypothetical protein